MILMVKVLKKITSYIFELQRSEIHTTYIYFDGTSTYAESSVPCRPPTRCEMRSALPADMPARDSQHRPFRGIAPRGLRAGTFVFSASSLPHPTSRIAPISRGHARGAHARRALGGRRVALLSPLLDVTDIYARDAATTFPTHPPSCPATRSPAKIHLPGYAA